MSKHPRRILLFIIILVLAAIYIDLPKLSIKGFNFSHNPKITNFLKRDLEPKLGLDLAGGIQLTLSADMSQVKSEDRENALESSKSIIEDRAINTLGVSEPVIQTAKTNGQYRLIIELPGVSKPDDAIATLKKASFLEFKTLKKDLTPEEATGEGTLIPTNYESTGLTGKDLSRAVAQPNNDAKNAGYSIGLEFNSDGAKKFEKITRENLGKPVAIFLDGIRISAPTVQSIISDGRAQITGDFTSKEASELAKQLNKGPLQVPLKIEGQTQIPPTLGRDYIQKSLIAGAIGIASVIIFMLAYYRFLGVFASIALLLYTTIVFALFKLIPVTLTLAGIAGFVLSIGMAVDANILIFERMKEERRWGKPKLEAFYSGFERAWSSIRDSNVSSLITTAVLFQFGTGPIRGFALTLAIGILVSMFSAVTVTRTLLRLFWVRGDNT